MSSSSAFGLLLSDSPPKAGYLLHNLTLLGVAAGDDGYEQLDVECAGERTHVRGCVRWHPERSTSSVGLVGCLKRVWEAIDAPAARFLPYLDQTLRRAEDLDRPDETAERAGRRTAVWGWRCAAKPNGFQAPAGLIPGKGGDFVLDDSVALTLRIPIEFADLCRSYGVSSARLLEAFIADVCDLRNTAVRPRADGLARQGSDESDLAEQWLQRAFGHQLVGDDGDDGDVEIGMRSPASPGNDAR